MSRHINIIALTTRSGNSGKMITYHSKSTKLTCKGRAFLLLCFSLMKIHMTLLQLKQSQQKRKSQLYGLNRWQRGERAQPAPWRPAILSISPSTATLLQLISRAGAFAHTSSSSFRSVATEISTVHEHEKAFLPSLKCSCHHPCRGTFQRKGYIEIQTTFRNNIMVHPQ